MQALYSPDMASRLNNLSGEQTAAHCQPRTCWYLRVNARGPTLPPQYSITFSAANQANSALWLWQLAAQTRGCRWFIESNTTSMRDLHLPWKLATAYGWCSGRLCRYPAAQARKNQTTTKPRRLLMTQLLVHGSEGKLISQMCQLTWRRRIAYSDAYHRTDAFPWRERSSMSLVNSAPYLLPRLGEAWPAWDPIDNHDATRCDVTKRSRANIWVKSHPGNFK